jgi:putative phosphoribosyl transferase
MLFHDRRQAGEKLAQELIKLAPTAPLVLALPRGGVPVGSAVARVLKCPCDVISLVKIAIPWNSEASYGIVVRDGTMVVNKPLINRLELSEPEVEMAAGAMLLEAKRREQIYRQERPFPALDNRTVILADDGLASGYSMLAAVSFVKKRLPRSIIVSSPVASDAAYRMLAAEKGIDQLVILSRDTEQVFSLADHYKEFPDLTDDDVITELSRACS